MNIFTVNARKLGAKQMECNFVNVVFIKIHYTVCIYFILIIVGKNFALGIKQQSKIECHQSNTCDMTIHVVC